jgi:hypothetical protein
MRWLRGSEPTNPGTGDLSPVRIFTDELELRGFIAPTGQRVTDMLLRGQDLAFLPEGAEPTPEAWVSVAPGDVLFVVPPPLANPAPAPEEYRLVDVTVAVGDHRIAGSIHLRQDERIGADLARRQAFLPVTRATLESPHAPPERVDVVIVNLSRGRDLRTVDPGTG